MADDEPHRSRRWRVIAIAAVIVLFAFALGLVPKLRQRAETRRDTSEMAVRTVAVIRPQRAAPTMTLVVPGNVQADLDAPIFSRATGYLARWYADIGAHVRKGELLARLSVPEVEQQLQQARDTLAVTQANLAVARTTAERFSSLATTKAVSQQEVDNAVGAFRANQATVHANQAAVRQLEQALEFAMIRAPFDGVITVRNVDVGDLINAGSSTTPRTELFHIVQDATLRIYVTVPEPDAHGITPGLAAQVRFTAFPGRTFAGKLVRTAKAIDPATRTLLAEVAVDNAAGNLFAGAFSEVQLEIPVREALILPVEALLFRTEGLHVATVEHGRIVMKRVYAGHDYGETIEVTEGLRGDELIVENPPDSITNGEEVRIAQPQPVQARQR